MPNRLAAEPSPYLQQHKDNPVEWWPWGEAAFAEARRRDVPVFVSIGYATCHWCHVMAHESFEDPGVARLMNEAFVNVKVDREERPDVDEAYMRVCQALTGSGGWPLNVVVTPDKKPFYAATYVPKTARFGRIGMMDLVPRLRAAWEEQREAVVHRATHIVEALAKEAPQSGPLPDAAAVADVVAGALDGLAARFDPVQGGFGGPPKFPSPQVLRLLLHVHARGGAPDDRALRMARTTLDAMARGGIRDHLGGGFHRYSTDAHWLVPHFEKMLYDQAMLLLAYAEAHAAAPRPEYREVVEDVVSYLERDLRHREGAFFSAEDADSEGEEGRFYTWTAQEIGPLLRRDVDLFLDAFGVRGEGNFHDEASGRPTGRNILHRPRPLAEVAAAHGLDEVQARSRLEDRRAQLLNARQERVRPLRDEKVLTDWNGLAVAALARASVCLGEPRFAARAAEAARFVLGRMHADGRLRHRWKDGRTDDDAFLDDHAFLLWGLVELHQATQEAAWLEAAVGVADALLERFEDPEGGFRTAPRGGELLPVRPLDAYDGALPSGNSVAVEALWRLGRLTGRTAYEQAAWRTVGRFAGDLVRHPAAFTGMLVGLQAALDAPREVVVAGPRGDAATLRLLEAVRPALGPGTALLLHDPDEPGLARLCPWLAGYGPVGGRPAAYVCRDHACERPVTDPARLAAALTSAPAAPTAPAR